MTNARSLGAMLGRTLLAWNLRRLRSERGLSQEKLAHDAGIDRAYLSELERELGNPSLEVLDRLAATLQETHAELLRLPDEGAERPKNLAPGRRPK
ncbi:MAG: helix-turn-helix transcriptional regulator [bacterium]|nr:helix-turn-helix transcriptional regulator [bacterium]